MNPYQVSIAGINFVEPILVGLRIDCGIGHIHLIVGESAPPFSWETPKYFKFVFEEVIEIRGYMSRKSCFINNDENQFRVNQKEEIDWTQDLDAQDEIDFLSDGSGVIKNTAFRDPGSSGRIWRVWDPKSLRLFWLSSDLTYIEFLYCGRVKITELSKKQFRE
ncbi:MAG: hypothetical protein HC924_13060 [Synechococcaceae cyanobacterium SM2_3_2]|nr:hypothetical protein [Synechococcaceae cyanobacterium SM2_3_2]